MVPPGLSQELAQRNPLPDTEPTTHSSEAEPMQFASPLVMPPASQENSTPTRSRKDCKFKPKAAIMAID